MVKEAELRTLDPSVHLPLTHTLFTPLEKAYMITLGKTCIVHISNFSTMVTHTIYLESQINVKYSESVEPLFFYHFKSVCHYLWFYGSPNEQNQTCELCMFSNLVTHVAN